MQVGNRVLVYLVVHVLKAKLNAKSPRNKHAVGPPDFGLVDPGLHKANTLPELHGPRIEPRPHRSTVPETVLGSDDRWLRSLRVAEGDKSLPIRPGAKSANGGRVDE
jgi:hypothetical protein